MTAAGIPVDVYGSEIDFFDEYFAHVFARPKSANWCLEWYNHVEARVVMEALWRSWEIANLTAQRDGFGVWIRDYAYPLLDRLMMDKGPFDGCDWQDERHKPNCIPLHKNGS